MLAVFAFATLLLDPTALASDRAPERDSILDRTRDLDVSVRSIAGPVQGAYVCAGTPEIVGKFGYGVTNSTGLARLTGLPDQAIVLVVSSARGGATIPAGAGMGAMTVTVSTAHAGAACTASAAGGDATRLSPSARLRVDASRLPAERLEPISRPPVVASPRYCFGALGADCGGAQSGIPTSALCAGGECYINAGSWEHDECCE